MDNGIRCNCLEHLEPYYIDDVSLPYGDVVSIQIYKCSKCGKEYAEFPNGLAEV